MKKEAILIGMLVICYGVLDAMNNEDKRLQRAKMLSGVNPVRNLTPTSPRTFKAWVEQNYSPRSRQIDDEGQQAEDTTLSCFLYYCLCMPLCHSCCQPHESYEEV